MKMNNFFSNTLSKASIILLSLFLTLGCNNDIDNVIQSDKDVELRSLAKKIGDDSDFIRFLETQNTITEKFRQVIENVDNRDEYVANIIDLIESGDNSYQNVNKVALLCGFSSANEYSDATRQLHFNLRNVLTKYPIIQDLDESELTNILTDASFLKNNCGRKLNNCRNSATANLALATAGCSASVFIPFAGLFLGPTCEVATIYVHYTSIEKCHLDYEDCTGA
jgi:hypothetical protein